MSMTDKEKREVFGETRQPIPATRVLWRALDPKHFGGPASAILAINDVEGTITQANIYRVDQGGKLGKNYDPQHYTHPLPAEDSDKWKVYRKKGYVEGSVADFRVLTPAEKPAKKAKAEAAKS